MELKIVREPNKNCTPGKFFIDDVFYAYSLEDKVRDANNDGDLNDPGEQKIAGQTAIPVGRYQVIVNMSTRFKRMMPLLLNVPGFGGIRIHGGNTDADTHGCPLIGKHRDGDRISGCKEVNEQLVRMLKDSTTDNFITII